MGKNNDKHPGTASAFDLDEDPYYRSEKRKQEKAIAGLSETDIPYLRGYTKEHIRSKALEEQLKPPSENMEMIVFNQNKRRGEAAIKEYEATKPRFPKSDKDITSKSSKSNKPGFAKGGTVRGSGCAKRGVKKCKTY